MSKTAYSWKPEAHVKANAQEVGERLEAIRTAKDGYLTPADVVADGRKKSSPLHLCFEWNDAKAAEAHRIDQARYVIRSLVVSIPIIDREPAVVRAFLSVLPPQEEGNDEEATPAFTSVEQALRQPELRAQIGERARLEFTALRKKYAELTELADVFTAIDRQFSNT